MDRRALRALAVLAARSLLQCHHELVTLRRILDPDSPMTGVVMREAAERLLEEAEAALDEPSLLTDERALEQVH